MGVYRGVVLVHFQHLFVVLSTEGVSFITVGIFKLALSDT